MAGDAEQLLKAEQAVQQLVKELEKLMGEVGGYATATKTLEDVRKSLQELIGRTSELAQQAHSAIAALIKIGTPEILARINTATAAIEEKLTSAAAVAAEQQAKVRTLLIASITVGTLSLLVSAAALVSLVMKP